MSRRLSTPDTESSFLDVPVPTQRRSWRRSQPTQGSMHAASLPTVMPEQRGNRLRKKGSRLIRNLSDGEPRRGSDGETGSVDSRASSAVVIIEPSSSPSNNAGSGLGSRMSSWWSSLVSEGQGREEGRWRRQPQRAQQGEVSSSRGLLATAKQRAVGGVRYLLDGDALPESAEDVWVRGVMHRFLDGETTTWPPSFLEDLGSTVWCTYRSQYAPIISLPEIIPTPETYRRQRLERITPIPPVEETKSSPWGWMTGGEKGLTSDAGWGCMLRTGQSLLANALVHQHLGRGWRLPIDGRADPEKYATYVQILAWFLDDPSAACPFSVHRMALVGKQLGKGVGEWFGPSTAAGAVKTLTNGFPPCGLAIVTATDSTIYASEVLAASHQDPGHWGDLMEALPVRAVAREGEGWCGRGVLVLAGVRLGMQGVNPLYHDSIKALFTFPQSVGIAGGRPSSSYYFIGAQGDNLFYLDPHFTRPAIPLKTRAGERDPEDPTSTHPGESEKGHVEWLLDAYTPEQLRTFHCEKVKKMPLSSLDPSMLMGFLCRDYTDWVDLRERLNNLPQRIISIEETVPTWGDDSDDPDIESFTETDVDEGSDGLSRQLSVSTGVFEAGDLSLTTDTEEEVIDLPRQSPSRSAADTSSPPSRSAHAETSSPPLTPTVSLAPGIPFPRPDPSRDEEPIEEDSFESIDVPLPRAASIRHRSRSSGDQTVLGARPVVAGREELPVEVGSGDVLDSSNAV